MKRFLAFSLFMVITLVTISTQALAGPGTVTVKLLASDGVTGVAGATVNYFKSGAQLFGVTDGNGEVTGYIDVAGTTTIHLIPTNGGTRIWLNVDPATAGTLTEQMVAVKIDLKTCAGASLVGEALYYRNGWTSLGNTPVTVDLLPFTGLGPGQGSYHFRMKYDGRTSQTLSQDISTNATVEFKTTKVDFAFAGTIQYYNSGWQTFVGPKEMIGGTENFGAGNIGRAEFRFRVGNTTVYQQYFNITGCNVGGALIRLVDENNAPLANLNLGNLLTYRSRCGGSWTYSGVPFQTDANGFALLNTYCAGNNWDGKITVNLNKTSLEQVVATNSIYQAAWVNVNLKTCAGVPIAGANVEQGSGTWTPRGTTDVNGQNGYHAFPGNNVVAKVGYNYGSQTLNATVTSPVTNIDFVTTKVNLNGATPIQIQAGGWPTVTFPMEMLPGTYGFRFNGNYIGGIAISGCEFTGTAVFAQMRNSSNQGLAGASFSWRIGWGDITQLGTDNTGNGIYFLVSGNPTYTRVTVSYNGATTEKTQNIQTNKQFIWNTVKMTASLKTEDDQTLLTADTWRYRHEWNPWIALDPVAGAEVLPVNVRVEVGYKTAILEKTQNANSNAHFAFNTKKVTASLKNEANNNDLTAGAIFQYRHGWNPWASLDPVAGEELLPVNTTVQVAYKGASVEKTQNVGTTSAFAFNTKKVTATLTDATNNNDDITTSATWDYRIGWGPWEPFVPAGDELLPVSTKVRATYNSTTKEKEQNVNTVPAFSFTWDGSKILKQIVDNMWSGISNYPNPVSDLTTINYSISEASNVRIYITDIFGNKISELINEFKAAGEYQVQWNVNNSVASGTYLYVIETNENVQSGTVQVVK